MKQSYSVYLFMLLISISAIASEEDRRQSFPPLPPDLHEALSPSSSDGPTTPRPPQHSSALEEIEQACNAGISEAQDFTAAKLAREKRLREIRAQRVSRFLKAAQNDQDGSSNVWIPATAATVAAGAASTITYLANKTKQIPTRGIGDLALDGATGGLSTGVQAAIYGGIALVTVGTGTAIVVSVKRAFSKMWYSIQKARGDNALAERHSKETVENLQGQIDELSTFATTGRK